MKQNSILIQRWGWYLNNSRNQNYNCTTCTDTNQWPWPHSNVWSRVISRCRLHALIHYQRSSLVCFWYHCYHDYKPCCSSFFFSFCSIICLASWICLLCFSILLRPRCCLKRIIFWRLLSTRAILSDISCWFNFVTP